MSYRENTMGALALAAALAASATAQAQNTWAPVAGEDAIVCGSLTASTDTALWLLGEVGSVAGAFRSTDGGESFTRLTLPGAGTVPSHLLAFDGDRAVAITRDVLARNWTAVTTSDGGASWSAPVNVAPLMDGGGLPISVVAARVVGPMSVVVVGTDGVRVSTDGGATWSTSGTGPPSMRMGAIFGAVASDAAVFAVVAQSRAITRTTDGGATWETVFADDSSAPPDMRLDAFTGIYFFDEQLGFAGTTLRGTFRTDDGGDTWTPVSQPMVAGDVPRLRVAAFATADLGLAVMRDRSSGSGQWAIHSTTNGGVDWVEDTLPGDFFDSASRQPGCLSYPRAGLGYGGTTAVTAYSLIRFGMPGSMPMTDAGTPDVDAAVPDVDGGSAVGSDGGVAMVGDAGDGGGGGGGCAAGGAHPGSGVGLLVLLLALALRRRRVI